METSVILRPSPPKQEPGLEPARAADPVFNDASYLTGGQISPTALNAQTLRRTKQSRRPAMLGP